ncbi:MAG: diguanylate cyclase [Myxococcales bacterium]|nr:diguanylate cyclase [Myxococcales bacterium]USN50511.1 MAG: diguanylate cyclase [Myxococcales bacterium]
MADANKNSAFVGKKSLPIGWRLSLYVAGTGSILCLGVLLLLLPFQYGRVEQDAIIEARILAEAVSAIYQRLGPKEPNDIARKLLLRVARTPHISLVNVYDTQGVVRYSTDSRELGRFDAFRPGVTKEDNLLSVTHLLSNLNNGIGSVSVFIDRDLMFLDTHRLFVQVGIGLFGVILVLSFLVKGLVERHVSFRLARLMHFIEDAEKGSFLIRAEVDRNDEIGHTIVGFNQLLGVITQIEARSLEKEHSLHDAEAQKNMRLKLEETLFQLERSNERLNSKVHAQELLMEAAHRLGGTLQRESVVDGLVKLIQEKLSWPQFALFLLESKNHDRHFLRLAATLGINKGKISQPSQVIIGEGVVGMVAQTGAPIIMGNLEKEKNLKLWQTLDRSGVPLELGNSGSLMAVPMIHKGRVTGVFLFLSSENSVFDKEDVDLIAALAAQTALATINAELYETTLELATSDPLTGILNRRAMMRQIEFELTRTQRFNNDLSLLLVDVDHFKAYNDRMGHVLGDLALKEIASALKSCIRKVDTVARFGGEEFCVILPQTDEKAASEVALKLCHAVRGLKLRGADKQALGHLSISIGIAVISGKADILDREGISTELIAAADQALYQAKGLGRDRFVVNRDFS